MPLFFLLIISLFFTPLKADLPTLFDSEEMQQLPVLYKGRLRPLEAYAKLWLYEISHSEEILDTSAVDLLWKLHFAGAEEGQNLPLFWISSKELKEKAGLSISLNRFSYNELAKAFQRLEKIPEAKNLLATMEQLQNFTKKPSSLESLGEVDLHAPLAQKIQLAGDWLKILPCKTSKGLWACPHAFHLSFAGRVNNFTLFDQNSFETLKSSYEKLESSFHKLAVSAPSQEYVQEVKEDAKRFAMALNEAYHTQLAGKLLQKAEGKTLYYPKLWQLKLEQTLYHYPLIEISFALYLLAVVCFAFSLYFTARLRPLAITFLASAFLLHSAILLMRSLILQRPPVTNMFESILYVPWAAVLGAIILRLFIKSDLLLLGSSALATLLLLLLELTHLHRGLENVQAVLDSQYWLMTHVLMVVGSYGLYLLGGILGHFYLVGFISQKKETPILSTLAKVILQCLYLGTALLIPGTILGGIWAAESWGRFWDWDPKEAWAFISICIYLIWIHAYRYGLIRHFGLAACAVSGILAISFTWYGVNYILGTGLHTYGFGQGGEVYYYLFLAAEALFLASVLFWKKYHPSQI